MACYFIAEIAIHNIEGYQKYLSGVDETVEKYNGKYLAVDENPGTIEGKAAEGRMVIIEFPDEETLKEWYFSPEYRKIIKFRLDSAVCRAAIVKGK